MLESSIIVRVIDRNAIAVIYVLTMKFIMYNILYEVARRPGTIQGDGGGVKGRSLPLYTVTRFIKINCLNLKLTRICRIIKIIIYYGKY